MVQVSKSIPSQLKYCILGFDFIQLLPKEDLPMGNAIATWFFFLIYLFIFGCIGSSLLCAGPLQLRLVGATLRCGARASHCGGLPCCRAQALGVRASAVVARRLSSCGTRALEHRLSSCGAGAQLLCGMWDPPGPGLKPVSPVLAGGFLTTAPPGKPNDCYIVESCTESTQVMLHSTNIRNMR